MALKSQPIMPGENQESFAFATDNGKLDFGLAKVGEWGAQKPGKSGDTTNKRMCARSSPFV
jgi:hypothetical protein